MTSLPGCLSLDEPHSSRPPSIIHITVSAVLLQSSRAKPANERRKPGVAVVAVPFLGAQQSGDGEGRANDSSSGRKKTPQRQCFANGGGIAIRT